MAVEYLGTGQPDGTNFGTATGKIGFYGLTAPIVKPSFTNAAVGTSLSSTTAAVWAWKTAAQTASVVALLNELRSQLVAFGLVTT